MLDRQLADNEWLAGDFSVADIANWSWSRIHNWAGISVDGLNNLQRWMAAIERRPGCAKGVRIPHETHYNNPTPQDADKFVSNVRGILAR